MARGRKENQGREMIDKEDEHINEIIDQLMPILQPHLVSVGSSAMICLLVCNAQKNKVEKDFWLEQLAAAWDFYNEHEKHKD